MSTGSFAGIGVSEFPKLQVRDNQISKPTWKKTKTTRYHWVPIRKRFCRANEGEVTSQLQQKLFELTTSAFSRSVSEYVEGVCRERERGNRSLALF
jgi:hypothetical protein